MKLCNNGTVYSDKKRKTNRKKNGKRSCAHMRFQTEKETKTKKKTDTNSTNSTNRSKKSNKKIKNQVNK